MQPDRSELHLATGISVLYLSSNTGVTTARLTQVACRGTSHAAGANLKHVLKWFVKEGHW